MAALLPAMPADLDSMKDANCAARNCPTGKQDKTVRGHSKEKPEGEQPRINVAATSDTAQESTTAAGAP